MRIIKVEVYKRYPNGAVLLDSTQNPLAGTRQQACDEVAKLLKLSPSQLRAKNPEYCLRAY